jgi:outer membrane protein TolC
MPASRSVKRSVKSIAILCAFSIFSNLGFAQTMQDYTKPVSPLTVFGPYKGRDVAAPNFTNATRVDQLMRDGKLMLSLNDAIALALENNLDLAIARYNLNIADTDILRTKAGGTARGVATGVVQNTPGGGTGSIGATSSASGAGGTSSGAGGAGTGTSGIVSSTSGVGPSVDSFDPIVTGNLSLQRTRNVSTSSFQPQTASNTSTANFNYFQGFVTGTALSVGFNNERLTTGNRFTTFSPLLNSSFRATLRQHLLQGFGIEVNRRFIDIAKNNREISDIAFRQQVISTVSQIQNIYWDLVNAYEDVNVKQRSLALAQRLLSDNQKQVEIGTLAPIEVVRAQSEVAARNQDLIVSQTNLQLQQLLIKNALTRNMTDPTLAAAPVIPTDTMAVTANMEDVQPVQDMIQDALAHRPDIAQARIDLTNRTINKKGARNALLPTLDAQAWYGASAAAGTFNPAAICENQTTPSFGCTPLAQVPDATGYGSAFTNLFNSSAPDKGAALTLSIPIRNRSAQADQVRSELEYRQAEMRMQQLQNQIGIEVRNAQFTVQQNRARVEAAVKGRELAAQSLDAESKKYALGASTNYNVLQAQRDLAQSESNLVTAQTSYEKSKVELDRVTARTLDRNNIAINDAETGRVNQMPSAPGVQPRTDINNTTVQAQPVTGGQAQPAPGQQQAPAQQTQPAPAEQQQTPQTPQQ